MNALSSHAPIPTIDPRRTSPAPRLRDTIRSIFVLLWIEIRRSQGFWLLPLMMGPVLYLNWNMDDPGVVLWPQLSQFILQSYLVIGPLGAGLAAWLIDRDRRRRTSGLVSTTSILPFRRDLVLLIAASFWGLAGYAFVAAWYGGLGVLNATWGGPDLPLIATGALAIIVYAAIGFLAGRMVPGKFSSLIAVAGTFCLAIAIDYLAKIDTSYRFLTPFGLVQHNEPSVYYRNAETYIGPSLVWLAGAIGMLVSIVALLRGRNLLTVGALIGSGMVASSGLASIMTYDGAGMFPGQARTIPFEFSCSTTTAVEVCVHPAYEAQLDEATATLGRLLQPVAGLEGVPTRWFLQNPIEPDKPDGGVLFDLDDVPMAMSVRTGIFLDKTDHMSVSTPQLVIMEWLSDRAGISHSYAWPYGWPSDVASASEAFADGAMGYGPDQAQLDAFEPVFDAAVARFAALGPEAQRAWLAANWDALRAGDLTLDDLP